VAMRHVHTQAISWQGQPYLRFGGEGGGFWTYARFYSSFPISSFNLLRLRTEHLRNGVSPFQSVPALH
jgi:hypothetical protein